MRASQTVESRVRIRPARLSDADEIGRILATALADKFRPAFGGLAARAMAAAVRADIARGGPAYWVSEHEGSVVGAVHLALRQEVQSNFFSDVAAEVGWPRAARAALVLGLLTHTRMAVDEAYVEELAVDPSARRLGAARSLLAACADEARRAGRRRLTLWVTTNNAPAIALYRSEGFVVRRRRRTPVGRLVFRAPGALFMERILTTTL